MTTTNQLTASQIAQRLANLHPQAVELIGALVKTVMVETHQEYTVNHGDVLGSDGNLTDLADKAFATLAAGNGFCHKDRYSLYAMRSVINALDCAGVEVNVNGTQDNVVHPALIQNTPAQDIADKLAMEYFGAKELSGETKEVDIILSALTRVEFLETIVVPVEADASYLESVVCNCDDSFDGSEYTDDNEYWETASKRYEINGARFDV